eukprot:5033069-Pyramimonas_sp.AAC.1
MRSPIGCAAGISAPRSASGSFSGTSRIRVHLPFSACPCTCPDKIGSPSLKAKKRAPCRAPFPP